MTKEEATWFVTPSISIPFLYNPKEVRSRPLSLVTNTSRKVLKRIIKAVEVDQGNVVSIRAKKH